MKIVLKGPFGVSDVFLPDGYTLGQVKSVIAQSMPQLYGMFKLVYDGQDMNDDSLVVDWLDQQAIDLIPLQPQTRSDSHSQLIQPPIHTHTPQPQQPQPSGIHMLVNKMPDDNSCLFHAIKRTIGIDLPVKSLRRIIHNTILGNPIQYTDAVLGKPRREYAASMLEEAWGGGIELAILAKYFQHEIAVVDVQSGHFDVFAEGCGYLWRVYLLYSGIHYDALELSNGTTKFKPDDLAALNCAKQISGDLRSQRQFTNTHTFTLECEQCGVQFKGTREAEHHAEMFGHAEFKEV